MSSRTARAVQWHPVLREKKKTRSEYGAFLKKNQSGKIRFNDSKKGSIYSNRESKVNEFTLCGGWWESMDLLSSFMSQDLVWNWWFACFSLMSDGHFFLIALNLQVSRKPLMKIRAQRFQKREDTKLSFWVLGEWVTELPDEIWQRPSLGLLRSPTVRLEGYFSKVDDSD